MERRTHEPLISPDDLAAYALDAHDAAGAAVIAAHLDTSPDAVRREQDLRSAAGEFAAAIVDEVSPRPSCVSGSSPLRAGAASRPRWSPVHRRSTSTEWRWRGRSCSCAT